LDRQSLNSGSIESPSTDVDENKKTALRQRHGFHGGCRYRNRLFLIFGSHFQYTFNKQRAADEALRESEEKYRSIVESIEEGYFETDLAGNINFCNDAFCKLLGYSRRELVGMNTGRLSTPETTRHMKPVLEELQRSGLPTSLTEYDMVRKAGDTVALELSVSLIQDADDQPIGYRWVSRDVSSRKKAEEEHKKLEMQLQQAQKMESIGTLAGGIAHDFNNILMGIQGNASLVLMKIDGENPVYRKIKNIETYVENGTELTRQLLGFARRGKYQVRATDLNEVIGNSASMFGRTKKEIQIEKQFADDLWTVEVDPGQIDQALLNLYVNAWQAMPQGGRLVLSTENTILDDSYDAPYQITTGRYVKVSVADTGVGIDPENQQRIFEPFFTTKEMGRGTGLGLASVYGIVKNHAGYIEVSSRENRGTTFTIYLPASEKKAVKKQERAETIRTGKETILLVDDEDMIIDVGREMLQELGYRVLAAKSGREALAIYQRRPDAIDLVIMDMIMPEMGGEETFDRLKAIDPQAKVLLSSGYSIDGQAGQIMEKGCDGFIQKPFKMQQISDKIRSILDRSERTRNT